MFLPLLDHLPGWVLVLTRMSGIFLLAPVLGSSTIPRLVKVFLVLGLSLCVYPMLWGTPGLAAAAEFGSVIGGGLTLWELGAAVGLELLIGFAIGYCASLPLIGLQIGGHVIDQQMGISAGGVYNPELDSEAGVAGQLLFMMGLAIFVLMGGHHVMLATLVGSFERIPIAGFVEAGPGFGPLVDLVLGLLTMAFEVALQVAAPLLCIVFLESVAMGFIARTVPQMNILSVGFIVRILGGLILLIVGIHTAAWVFRGALVEMLDLVARFFVGGG